ncbi:MAG: cell envelope integrity protein TolA [Wenzhouxiangella sp.]
MISQARKQAILDQLQALGLALGVHLLMVAVLVLGSWNWQPFERELPPVQVTLVDMGPIIEQRRAEEAEREAEQARAEQQRRDEAERQRQAEQQARQEAERQRQAEEQARLEQQRQAEEDARRQQAIERRERELEAQRQAEAQARREEQRRLAEAERQREEEERMRELAELRAEREAAERERQEQERRLAEIAERREAQEAEQRAREEAERLRLAQEQAQADARRATLREEYIITIQTLVTRNWTRPPTTRPGVACTVRVFQIPGGEIIAAEIVRPCNADQATRRSIVAAVNRVGELPYRGYERVFSREIDFVFRFDG